MSTEVKTANPVTRAVLAIIALVVIVVSANLLVSSLGIGHKNADFTENKIHTLSDGTKGILKDLKSPVVIRYYATRSSDYMSETLKLHMRRVDDLLAEYENLAPEGKLRIEELDPEPDTDAEDSANLDGIRGQPVNEQNVYFGLAISCLDRTATIPFLDPNEETMLEYNLSRAISEVSRVKTPVIGFMTGLPITGSPAMMPGQQGQRPWIIYTQLSQSYDVREVSITPESIDPELDALVIFHPAGITPEAEFAIDQYLLGGGTVVACIDPYSVAAKMAQPSNPMNPMMSQPGLPVSSTLPTLLESWGITMSTQVVGDEKYQTSMDGGRPGIAVLSVPQEGMPQDDNVITRDLSSLVFFLPGGLTKSGDAGVAVETLVKSSDKAALVDATRASMLDEKLTRNLKGTQSYNLVMHLSGNFKTAFPDGKPDKENATDTDEEDKPEESAETSLTEATAAGNVFLISDIDAFFDRWAYRQTPFGYAVINGNSSLLLNIVDQAASSTHLIGARSRAAIARPFTKIKELEADANKRVGDEIKKIEQQLEEATKKINDLQAQKTAGSELILSPEQEEELRNYNMQQIEFRKQVRELQKDLRRDKDRLAGIAMASNVFGMPILVVLVGIGLFVKRRSSTRAR